MLNQAWSPLSAALSRGVAVVVVAVVVATLSSSSVSLQLMFLRPTARWLLRSLAV